MLSLRNIEFTFNKNSRLAQKILKGINFEVNNGDFVMLLGGNGAGKSTLLNILSGFLKADNGNIVLEQSDITNFSQSKKSKFVSLVMQDPKISTMEHMSIYENLAFASMRSKNRTLRPFFTKNREKIFKENLAVLNMGLEDRLDELVLNLSGGQRQALSLCMALLGECKLLLLDEICAALDPNIAEMVMNLTYEIAKRKKITSIMITHNMEHAIRFADKIIVLSDGKVLKEYAYEEIKNLTPGSLAALL